MASIGEILIGMKVDNSGLSSGLKSGSSMLGSFGSTVMSTKGNVIALGAAVAAIGTGAIASWIKSTIDAIDTQGDLAQQLDLSTGKLQQLQAAAIATGSDAETMNAALGKLQLGLGEAQSGSGAASEAFKRLGLSASELLSMPVEKQFRVIAAALDDVSNSNEQAALTADIFGKANLGLLNTINSGTEALDKAGASALATGFALSDIDNTNIADAQEALDKVGGIVTSVANLFAAALAPAIKAVADDFVSFARYVLEEGSAMRTVISYVGYALHDVIKFIEEIYGGVKYVSKAMWDWIETIKAVSGAFNEFVFGVDKADSKTIALGKSVKSVADAGDEAAKSVNAIGADIDTKVITKLKDSITAMFDELDKRLNEFGKTKFKIGNELIEDTRKKERTNITNDAARQRLARTNAVKLNRMSPEDARKQIAAINKKEEKDLTAFDKETNKKLREFREKSTQDTINQEKKAADEKKKADEKAAAALAKTEAEKIETDNKKSAMDVLKTLEGPLEKYEKDTDEIFRLNTTNDKNGNKLLSDEDYERAKAALAKDYETAVKDERDKEYDTKLKALEEKKNSKQISMNAFNKDKKALDSEYDKHADLKEEKKDKPEFKLTGLAELGSNAARETILANRFGGKTDLQKSAVDIAKQQLGTQQQLVKAVAKINIANPIKGKRIA